MTPRLRCLPGGKPRRAPRTGLRAPLVLVPKNPGPKDYIARAARMERWLAAFRAAHPEEVPRA